MTTTPSSVRRNLIARLAEIVGSTHVLVDHDVRVSYETDWMGQHMGEALAVVRPANTADVAAVMSRCAELGVSVVPQGGNTGLVGGGVPRGGEVVLSTRRLQEIDPVDALSREVTVGAGATLAEVQAHVREVGLDVGVDLASRDSATIGGMVATNAGGSHGMRYGFVREQLVGIEAVLSDGRVLRRLDRPVKDNTGYHFPSLLAGSEGTLAVVTRARLRLIPQLEHRTVAVLAFAEIEEAVRCISTLLASLDTLEAAELFFDDGAKLVERHLGVVLPLEGDYPVYVLIEAAGHQDQTAPLTALLDDDASILDVAVAEDRAGRDRLWSVRDGHTEAISHEGIPCKLDVSIPLSELAAFTRETNSLLADLAPEARPVVFGHIGDGNLHVNILGPLPDRQRVEEGVLRLTVRVGGAISAEHGIGVAKVRWLGIDRTPTEIDAMIQIKRALDPAGILNPGVLWPIDENSPGLPVMQSIPGERGHTGESDDERGAL